MEYTTSSSLEFFRRLARAQNRLARRFDGHLGAFHGLSFADLMILLELGHAEGGKLRRVDLAERLGVTASAVTRLLIPLERIGLVTREPDPNDARVGYASLTKAATRLLGEALEAAETIGERELAGLSPADLKAATKALDRLLD